MQHRDSPERQPPRDRENGIRSAVHLVIAEVGSIVVLSSDHDEQQQS